MCLCLPACLVCCGQQPGPSAAQKQGPRRAPDGRVGADLAFPPAESEGLELGFRAHSGSRLLAEIFVL